MPESKKRTGVALRGEAVWIGLGATALLVHEILKSAPGAAERYFSRGLFVGFRWAWDFSLGLLPIPLVYIALILLLGWIFARVAARRRDRRRWAPAPHWKPSLLSRLGSGLVFVLSAAGAVVFLFYVLWGFNYARPPIEESMDLRVLPLDQRALRAEAAAALRELTEARDAIEGAGPGALNAGHFPDRVEGDLRRSLSDVIKSLGFPAPGRPRVRRFRPGTWLMRFFISGIYVPFLGEGYVADALTPPELPFAMAHEMTHGFGFTEEGTANFLAWLACEGSEEAAIRYSGRLAYWGYITVELRRSDPKEFRLLMERLPEGVRADLRAASLNWNRFRGRLSTAAREVNDRYLKSQGVREGVLSYNRMVALVRAWRLRPGA
jgi:uncharacterized protein DUF3810